MGYRQHERRAAKTIAIAVGLTLTTQLHAQESPPGSAAPPPVPAAPSGSQAAPETMAATPVQAAAAASGAQAAPATASGSAQAGTGLKDIVVTAQRRSERLQQVPASITAVTSDDIARANITSTRDLQRVAPTLAFTQSSFVPGPSIRGIGARGSTPGDEQEVPLYIDGVYQPFLVGGVQELNNIERVEVLNGPQGVLLGRNAIGGAVNIVTAQPTVEPHARFMLGYGSYNRREAQAYVTGGTGNIAASLAAAYSQDDGYDYSLTENAHVASVDSKQIRGKVYWKPGSETEITVAAGYQYRRDSTGTAAIALNGNTVAAPLIAGGVPVLPPYVVQDSPQYDPHATIKQTTASLIAVHHFSGFDVTSSTGFNHSSARARTDSDGTVAFSRYLDYLQRDDGVVQETYVTSTGLDRLRLIAGGFFLHDIAKFDPINSSGSVFYTRTSTDAYAFYAQAAFDLTSRLTITAGGRYSFDHKHGTARDALSTRFLDVSANFSHFDPSVTVDYKIADPVRAYAKYSTAFKSGLFNNTSFSRTPVGKEVVRSYEVGVKSEPANWLRLNAATYYSTYDQIQVASRDPITGISILQNAASAKIYGGEINFEAQPVRALQLRGALTALHSEYGRFPFAAVQAPRPPFGTVGGLNPCPAGTYPCGNNTIAINAEGHQLTRIPNLTASFGADYKIETGIGSITPSATIAYTSRFNWQPDSRVSEDPRADVNAQIGFIPNNPRFQLTFYVENLTDHLYFLSKVTSASGDIGYYGRPRTFGIRLSTKL